jgi:hypothetical protein
MIVSGNSTARAAFDVAVRYGGALGAAVEGALMSIATGEQTITDASGITMVIRRDQVMPYLQSEGWLKVISSMTQLYQLAPKLAGNATEIVVVFSLHEEGMVWMHSVTFADGTPVTKLRLVQMTAKTQRAH